MIYEPYKTEKDWYSIKTDINTEYFYAKNYDYEQEKYIYDTVLTQLETYNQYWYKSGTIYYQNYSRSKLITDSDFKEEFEGSHVGVLMCVYQDVIPCDVCGCLPQIRQDKTTGKFYCTCPSSFYGDNQEIDDEGDNNYMRNLKDILVDTPEEAVINWNTHTEFEELSNKIKDVVLSVQNENECKKSIKESIETYFKSTGQNSLYDRIRLVWNIINKSKVFCSNWGNYMFDGNVAIHPNIILNQLWEKADKDFGKGKEEVYIEQEYDNILTCLIRKLKI